MRTSVVLLFAALPALADFRPLDTRCAAGQGGCFAELAKVTAPCEEVLRRRAPTAREDTVADWRRCPVSGFRTVHDVDYVVLSDPQGPFWAFTNFVDPTLAVVKDFRFLGKRVFLLETASTRDKARRFCFLDLSDEHPTCMSPPLSELEEKVQALVTAKETLCCEDWSLTDVTAKKVVATRPVFRDRARVGTLTVTLGISPPEITLRKVERSK